MRIFGQTIDDNADIAKSLMERHIAFSFVPNRHDRITVKSYFVVSDDDSHRAQHAVDVVLAKSRYYFAP